MTDLIWSGIDWIRFSRVSGLTISQQAVVILDLRSGNLVVQTSRSLFSPLQLHRLSGTKFDLVLMKLPEVYVILVHTLINEDPTRWRRRFWKTQGAAHRILCEDSLATGFWAHRALWARRDEALHDDERGAGGLATFWIPAGKHYLPGAFSSCSFLSSWEITWLPPTPSRQPRNGQTRRCSLGLRRAGKSAIAAASIDAVSHSPSAPTLAAVPMIAACRQIAARTSLAALAAARQLAPPKAASPCATTTATTVRRPTGARRRDCRNGQVNAFGGLFHLEDSSNSQRYLVDTGAAVRVLPHRSTAPLPVLPSLVRTAAVFLPGVQSPKSSLLG